MKRASIGGFAAAALVGAFAVAQEDAPGVQPEGDANAVAEKEVDATEISPGAEEACFIVRDIDNFHAFSDEFVFVEARSDDNYLLTMWPGCFALEGALGIAISSPMSRVCSTSGAEIRYRGFGRLETCRIRVVEAVESKEAAESLAEQRSAAP
jgi:hypothetical protein